jgi:hypothetical protein
MCEKLRMASFFESKQTREGAWIKLVGPEAKLWRAHYGTFRAAWDRCVDDVKSGRP